MRCKWTIFLFFVRKVTERHFSQEIMKIVKFLNKSSSISHCKHSALQISQEWRWLSAPFWALSACSLFKCRRARWWLVPDWPKRWSPVTLRAERWARGSIRVRPKSTGESKTFIRPPKSIHLLLHLLLAPNIFEPLETPTWLPVWLFFKVRCLQRCQVTKFNFPFGSARSSRRAATWRYLSQFNEIFQF